MDKPVTLENFKIKNFYPDSDSISIMELENTWNITIWRDEWNEIHVLIAILKDGTQMSLILGSGGYTLKY